MRRVPQYMAMRLEEVICQLLWQATQTEPSCSIEKLMSCLRNVYRDLQPGPPSYDAVRAALSALVTAGAVYFSGKLFQTTLIDIRLGGFASFFPICK